MKTKTGLPAKFFKIRVSENKKILHEYTFSDFLYLVDMAKNILEVSNKDGAVLVEYFYCGASITNDLLWSTRCNSGDLLKLNKGN